jgi:hypothetical protein
VVRLHGSPAFLGLVRFRVCECPHPLGKVRPVILWTLCCLAFVAVAACILIVGAAAECAAWLRRRS